MTHPFSSNPDDRFDDSDSSQTSGPADHSARYGAGAQASMALADVVEAGAPLVGSLADVEHTLDIAERSRRLAAAGVVDVMQAIDTARIHYEQGHASARVFVQHLQGLSGSESFRLDRIRRMVYGGADLVDKAWRCGDLGIDQAAALAKVFANGRVRDRFLDDQIWFINQAQRLSFKRFEQRIARWVRLVDDDGATPEPDPSHERRNATINQDHFSQAWHLLAVFGSLAGTRFNEVFQAYCDAEFAIDWAEATERLGEGNVTADDLARTPAQRRADALSQIAEDAAANPNASVRVKRVHNIVWKGETAEAVFARWFGVNAGPLNPDDYGVTDLNGHSIHEYEAFADLLASPTSVFRRVIQNHAGVTVDLTSASRFYTGLVRLGVELQTHECYWPGCHRPTTQCQIDHTRPAARGGPTNQSNGGPACPRHNRVKEAGYTVTRLPDGTFSITTPNGEPVIGARR